MNLSNFRIKAALAGLTLLVGTTVTPAVASNSVSSTKPQESNSKVIGNQKILLAQATDLTGTWSCGGGNIIYIRQVDSEIWWLNESSDGGLSFTNVFNGTVFNGLINGKFADVPKGVTHYMDIYQGK